MDQQDHGKRALSSRFHPWGAITVFFIYAPLFLLFGAKILSQGDLSGFAFVGVGLAMTIAFWLYPKAKRVEFDDACLYVRGITGSDKIPLGQIERHVPFRSGRGAFWIEFKSETKFGRSVLVSMPIGEVFADFPIARRFDETAAVKELLDKLGHKLNERAA